MPVFLADDDRRKFIEIIARHLDKNLETDYPYEKYDVELIAYCLMGNHIHFLVYAPDDGHEITRFTRSLFTAYSMYFNRKYKRHGHLFESVFKAAHITREPHLAHITRYIHMNPRTYRTYKWSSIRYYTGESAPGWLHPERVLDMTPTQYLNFLASYEGRKAELELLKNSIAG